jgi:PleD family two-component response regulator
MDAGDSSEPVGPPAPHLDQVSALASPNGSRTRLEPSATILIVEDHDDSRDAMGQLVTALGYRAILAGTGAKALTLLQDSCPDLILCDVRMPGMDGFACFGIATRSTARPSPGASPPWGSGR